jgi:anti-sigma-K factor RskA
MPDDRNEDQAGPWIGWTPWILAACFATLCVVLISIGQTFRRQASELDGKARRYRAEAVELRSQVESLEGRIDRTITNYQDRILEVQKQAVERIREAHLQTAAITNRLEQEHAETRRTLARYRGRAAQLARDNEALSEALIGATVGSNERLASARLAILRPVAGGNVSGQIGAAAWSPQDQRGLLVIEGLPSLSPSQTYQIWLHVADQATPFSGGAVAPGNSGSVRSQFTVSSPLDTVDRFSITIEPKIGVMKPTGKVVMEGK